MRIVISSAAEADLANIFNYTLTNWGESQAEAYLDALTARFAWLSANRSLWRERNDLQPGLYSHLEGRHLIFYREAENRLQIIRVLHQRMDPERYIKA